MIFLYFPGYSLRRCAVQNESLQKTSSDYWSICRCKLLEFINSRMYIQSKGVTVLVIIFLGCSAVAKENEKCDRIQFSIDDQNSINTSQNFTKQSFEKNGQPVYYSYSDSITENYDEQIIIWRNKENNTWLSQTRPHIGNKTKKTKTKNSHQNFFFSINNLANDQ